jgi:hypothetical protein
MSNYYKHPKTYKSGIVNFLKMHNIPESEHFRLCVDFCKVSRKNFKVSNVNWNSVATIIQVHLWTEFKQYIKNQYD